MSTFHKPRVFRSGVGCCICKAKSSSSRFTDSSKYEDQFQPCFQLQEEREGEICNACVLLVKRWKKLPKNTKRNWAHVVDARAGPGIKTCGRPKKKLEDRAPEEFKKIRKKLYKTKHKKNIDSEVFDRKENHEPMDIEYEGGKGKSRLSNNNISDFFDQHYWKREETCCGIILRGQCGELMVDYRQFSPCSQADHQPRATSEERKEDTPPLTVESLIESELRKLTEINSDVRKKPCGKEKTDPDNDEGFSDKASTATGPSSPDSCRLVLEED